MMCPEEPASEQPGALHLHHNSNVEHTISSFSTRLRNLFFHSMAPPRDPDLHRAITLRPRPTYHRNSSDIHEDLEHHTPPSYNSTNDPYALRDGLKTADQLDGIRANTSRKRAGCTPVVGQGKAKQMHAFYEQQNDNIERMLKPVDEHVRLAKEKLDADSLQYKIAVVGSLVVC